MRRRWLEVVLIASLVVSGMAQSSEQARTSEVADEPIIVLPEDICEIEITPTEAQLLISQPYEFYEMYLHLMNCEPPPPRYKCQGCRNKSETFYECFHETMNPNELCKRDKCIKNEVKVKDCYVSNSGVEDCRVLFDPVGNPDGHEGNFVTQTAIQLSRGRRCNAQNQSPVEVMQNYVGCPRCGVIKHVGRCIVGEETCVGTIVDQVSRSGRFLCSPNRCPDAR